MYGEETDKLSDIPEMKAKNDYWAAMDVAVTTAVKEFYKKSEGSC